MIEMPIDRLVHWTFAIQKADKVRAQRAAVLAGLSGGGSSLSSLMVKVDSSGAAAKQLGAKCAPDAEVVRATVERLAPTARALVAQHGRRGDTPDWCAEGWSDDQPTLQNKPGRPRRHRDDRRPSREMVRQCRADYRLWHEALVELRRMLIKDNRLTDHLPMAPAVQERPWANRRNGTVLEPYPGGTGGGERHEGA